MSWLPPLDSMPAVNAARPSLPFGSLAAPVLKSKRKVTRGDEFGNNTVAIAFGAFPAFAIGAKTDAMRMSAAHSAPLLLRSMFRRLLMCQRHDGAVFGDKIFLCH